VDIELEESDVLFTRGPCSRSRGHELKTFPATNRCRC